MDLFTLTTLEIPLGEIRGLPTFWNRDRAHAGFEVKSKLPRFLSTGEAEYYGWILAAQEALCLIWVLSGVEIRLDGSV